MDAVEPILLGERELSFRAATLHTDRGFKSILRVMKADILQKWANAKTPDEREALHGDLRAVQRLADTVQSLAENAEMTKRREEAEHKKALRRPGVDKSSSQW